MEVKLLSGVTRQAGRGHLLGSLSPACARGLLRVKWLHVPGRSWLRRHPHRIAQRNLPPPAAAASSGISSALPCSSPFPAASEQRAEGAVGDAGISNKPTLHWPSSQESAVLGMEPAPWELSAPPGAKLESSWEGPISCGQSGLWGLKFSSFGGEVGLWGGV